MTEEVLKGILGGLCTVIVGALSAVLIYRRAVKVEKVKNDQDTEIRLIDKWREYSDKLEKVKREQEDEIENLRAENRKMEKDLRKAQKDLERAQEQIEELREIVELQSRQITKLESRLDDIDGEGVEEA